MIYTLINNPFFLNALIAAVLAAILCSMIGTYVVTRRMVIMGGGMAHASLGGVGLGAYFGFSPLLGAAAFCLLSGFGIRRLSRLGGEREDAAVAMLWTLGMSVGIVFAGLTPGFVTDLNAYLFGDILAVGQTDLVILATLTVLALLFFGFFGRRIALVACDADFARTRGLPVQLIEDTLVAFTALTIVGCLHIAGIVMVISLLSVPQATAALFARTFRSMIWLSALTGAVGCLAGMAASFWGDLPCGATIVLTMIAVYFMARAIKRLFPSLYI